MSDNPYQAFDAFADPDPVGAADPKLDKAAHMLRQTKPWVRFISVMMFIGSGFMVLAGFAIMAGDALGGDGLRNGVGVAMGGVYIVMSLVYIAPAIFLWRYADRIAIFVNHRSTGTLAAALEAQKSFWKFVGIMMLVLLAIYALIFAFALLGGIFYSL